MKFFSWYIYNINRSLILAFLPFGDVLSINVRCYCDIALLWITNLLILKRNIKQSYVRCLLKKINVWNGVQLQIVFIVLKMFIWTVMKSSVFVIPFFVSNVPKNHTSSSFFLQLKKNKIIYYNKGLVLVHKSLIGSWEIAQKVRI